MKSRILFLFILLSILITSCNTSNKVVSSSFIQKRKYTKGYHFDLASKRANSHQPFAISQKHPDLIGMAKQIIPVHKKEIPSWEENRKAPVILDSVLGDNRDLSASVDNGTVILSNQKMIFTYENFIQQKENPIRQPDNKKFSKNNNIGFSLSLLGFFLGFIPLVNISLGILGIIYCSKALKEIKENPDIYKGHDQAGIGVYLGIIDIILGIYWSFLILG